MHVIIDGYNLLGYQAQVVGHGSEAAEADRERLLRELMEYRQRKGHPVTVVFDAWRQGVGAERHEHRAGVQVIYSRQGERADQVIQRLAVEFGHDCVVVSSDREVADFARAHSAFVIGAAEFHARLRAGRRSGHLSPAMEKDIDAGSRPRRNPEKKGNPKKLPKAIRKRNRQLRGF
jgi:predicted RNA-binding protein with PIN domain